MSGIQNFLRPGSRYFEQALFLAEEDQRFAFDRVTLPSGWERTHSGKTPWTIVSGPELLPEAGWKLHVAARLQDAEETLDIVARVSIDLGINFKYMPARNILHMMERKYAPRTSAGKFVTVYPADAAQAETLLGLLGPLLQGREAAVPVTDVPIAGTPLGARYGAFRERWIGDESGLDTLAIRTDDGGLRPDLRASRPTVPAEVDVPKRVAEALAQHRRTQQRRTIPYVVTRALHRSNGGGVYQAHTASGERIVLKDARRHTGLGLDGRDAAAALADESRALRALSGIQGVPRHVADFDLGERVFLAMEHMPGSRAIEFVARHHPGVHAGGGQEAWTRYDRRVRGLIEHLRAVIQQIHRRRWSFGDLHPGNVLLGEDNTVSLVDFETATDDPDAAGDRFTVAPGFRLQGLSAFEADLKRIDLIHLWALCPDNAFWEFSDQVLADRVHQVRDLLPEATAKSLLSIAHNGFSAQRWGQIVPIPQHQDKGELLTAAQATLREAVVRWGMDDTNSPIPVDAGGVRWSLGGGVAGLLWVAGSSAGGRFDQALDRLAREAVDSPRVRPGLFTGDAGTALVLGEHERREQAAVLMERALAGAAHVESPGLESGLAGIGWAALSTGRLDEAADLALRALGAVEQGQGGRGLMEGASGPALLALRLAHVTDDAAWLERAASTLAYDLQHIVRREDGTVLLDRGNLKHQPDLGFGSLGVALTALRLHREAPDPELAELTAAAGRTCLDSTWATQGLMRGRIGALAYLAERGGDRTAEEEELLVGNLRALRRYLVLAEGRVHLPGHLHLRFSHSLDSGLAGAVSVLAQLRDPNLPLFPGLDPQISPPPRCDRRVADRQGSTSATHPNDKEHAS